MFLKWIGYYLSTFEVLLGFFSLNCGWKTNFLYFRGIAKIRLFQDGQYIYSGIDEILLNSVVLYSFLEDVVTN